MLIQRDYQWTKSLPTDPASFIFMSDNIWPDAHDLVLPYWLPRQAFIVSCRARFEGVLTGQFVAAIDRGSLSFLSGDPPGHQVNADFSQCDGLVSLNSGMTDTGERPFAYPKLLDRDRGDRINMITASHQPGVYSMMFGFAFEAPVLPGAFYPSPLPGWNTIADWNGALNEHGAGAFEGDNGGWNNYTLMIVLEPLAFTFPRGGSDLRVSFAAAASGSWDIIETYIGPRAPNSASTALSLVPLAFGGQHRVSIPAGKAVTSDPLGHAMDFSHGAIIKTFGAGPGGTIRTLSQNPGWRSWWVAGNQAANVNSPNYNTFPSTAMSYGTPRAVGLRKIEMQF